jgi:hypothetical protein
MFLEYLRDRQKNSENIEARIVFIPEDIIIQSNKLFMLVLVDVSVNLNSDFRQLL